MTTPTDDTSYAVSPVEARFYYAGLPSEPTLVYRTGKPWSPPRNPEARPPKKELRPVFNHPIVDLWSGVLGPEVVKILDTHQVLFTTIDVVRFKSDEPASDDDDDEEDTDADVNNNPKETNPSIGPVTIWIGVFPESTRPSVAHTAAQDILSLLARHQITDTDVDFRESLYTHQAGPPLHPPVPSYSPLLTYISPLTPALGLPISTKARPAVQGTMGLYLDSGDDAHTLLGLTCRHVLLDPKDGNFAYPSGAPAPPKDVLLLGQDAYAGLVDAVQHGLEDRILDTQCWRRQVGRLLERERGADGAGAAMAARERAETEKAVDEAEAAIGALAPLLEELKTRWRKPDDRVLGPVVCSPPIAFGVGAEQLTEDWCIFKVDRAKLGAGFQGNKIDLGTNLSAGEFTRQCASHPAFAYPDDRLLPLRGTLPAHLMQHPDTHDPTTGEPSLLVIKNGSATGTTLGRATGALSLVRHYYAADTAVRRTSAEWGVVGYGGKSGAFSEPGDSGAVVAGVCGRVGGLLTGGCGAGGRLDVAYATPFWWLLPRIRARLPGVSVDVDVNVS